MWWSRLRQISESFWVLPAALGVAAAVLAEAMLQVDRHLVGDTTVWVFSDLTATGSRSLLTTIGGSMLGVAATSFSITISVLATTSSTYGPRLVRNFMADRGNQLVLAVLTSSFVYCLIVLRAVRSGGDQAAAFVPTVSVHVAVLLALLDVAVLVYFIHHIASSTQVTSLQQRVGRELDAVVELLYPETTPQGRADAVPPAVPSAEERSGWTTVASSGHGFVRRVAVESLVRRAAEAGLVVEVLAGPGRHVIAGEPLACADRPLSDEEHDEVEACFDLGPARTPHQDLDYAVQQLTEMAVRALSPGTNDPYTAIGALEALAPGLVRISERHRPAAGYLDEDGRVRVVQAPPTPEALVRPVLAAMRAWGGDRTDVVVAAIHLATRLRRADPDGPLAGALDEEVGALVDCYLASDPHPVDRARVDAALALMATP